MILTLKNIYKEYRNINNEEEQRIYSDQAQQNFDQNDKNYSETSDYVNDELIPYTEEEQQQIISEQENNNILE